jgi:hypothetical protein
MEGHPMFNWFRRGRSGSPSEASIAKAKRPPPANQAPADFQPTSPLPQVLAEGNTHADWSAWEDSMTALDSQFASVDPAARVQVRESRFGSLEEDDPFAGVERKRRP